MDNIELEELSQADEEAGNRHHRKYGPENGLTTSEAATLLKQYGPNALPEKKKAKVCCIRTCKYCS